MMAEETTGVCSKLLAAQLLQPCAQVFSTVSIDCIYLLYWHSLEGAYKLCGA